jgi:hypothetical protein
VMVFVGHAIFQWENFYTLIDRSIDRLITDYESIDLIHN